MNKEYGCNHSLHIDSHGKRHNHTCAQPGHQPQCAPADFPMSLPGTPCSAELFFQNMAEVSKSAGFQRLATERPALSAEIIRHMGLLSSPEARSRKRKREEEEEMGQAGGGGR